MLNVPLVAAALILSLLSFSLARKDGASECLAVPREHGIVTTPPAGVAFAVVPEAGGSAVSAYSPNERYTITLSIPSWQGIAWSVYHGSTRPCSFSAQKAGSVAPLSSSLKVSQCDGVTHCSSTFKTEPPQLTWTAPSSGTGNVTIYAAVVVSKGWTVYFVSRTICEEGVSGSSSGSHNSTGTETGSTGGGTSGSSGGGDTPVVVGDDSGGSGGDVIEDDDGDDVGIPASSAPGSASPAASSEYDLHHYANTVALHPRLSLSFAVLPSASAPSIALKLNYSAEQPIARNALPWLAIGVNSRRAMVGTDAIVVEATSVTTAQDVLSAVNQYVLSSKDADGVTMVPRAQQTLNRTDATSMQIVWLLSDWATLSSASGSVPAASALVRSFTVEFQRPAGTTSTAPTTGRRELQRQLSGALSIPVDGSPATLIYGLGSPGQSSLGMHSSLNTGSAVVDFASGAASVDGMDGGIFTTEESEDIAKKVHGALMFIAWALLAPAGILSARFFKGYPLQSSTCWFVSHKAMQIAAVVVSCLSFLLAILIVSPGPHFDGLHSLVGLAVVVAGIVQLFVGALCRPPKQVVVRPASPDGVVKELKARPARRVVWEAFHKTLGYGTAIVAVVAIFLGLREYSGKLSGGVALAYGVLVALTVILWTAWEAQQRLSAPQKAPAASQASSSAAGRSGEANGPVVVGPNSLLVYLPPPSAPAPQRSGVELGGLPRQSVAVERAVEEEEGGDDGAGVGGGSESEQEDPTPHYQADDDGADVVKSIAPAAASGVPVAASAPVRSP